MRRRVLLRVGLDLLRDDESSAFHPRAADDRVTAVPEAHPSLPRRRRNLRPDHERRLLAADVAALLAFWIDSAPHPDERVVFPLPADRRLVRVPRIDAGPAEAP